MLRVNFIAGMIITGIIALSSCHTSQQLMDPTLSLKNRNNNDPKFLDNISLAGNSNNIRINSIETNSDLNSNHAFNPSLTNILQVKYASLMGVIPQSISNLSLYSFIDEWYGVRYRLGGIDKSGIDCSAFVQKLYDQVFCTSLVRTAVEQFSFCSMVYRKDKLKEGDLVFFKTKGKRISHVGVYLVNNFFVHASTNQGVTISSLDDRYWHRSYAGAGKI
jgi:cell wall-associated NlpC family hydrolase